MTREKEKEIEGLKILLMEKNRETEKWKDLWLKQREEIKSLLNDSDSSMMISSRRLHDHLLDEFASLKVTLQSIAHDVAQLKAETLLLYSGRINHHHHTHFTSPPMSMSLYDRGDVANKPRLLDNQDDYYTSCHYTNSHHHPIQRACIRRPLNAIAKQSSMGIYISLLCLRNKGIYRFPLSPVITRFDFDDSFS